MLSKIITLGHVNDFDSGLDGILASGFGHGDDGSVSLLGQIIVRDAGSSATQN